MKGTFLRLDDISFVNNTGQKVEMREVVLIDADADDKISVRAVGDSATAVDKKLKDIKRGEEISMVVVKPYFKNGDVLFKVPRV